MDQTQRPQRNRKPPQRYVPDTTREQLKGDFKDHDYDKIEDIEEIENTEEDDSSDEDFVIEVVYDDDPEDTDEIVTDEEKG